MVSTISLQQFEEAVHAISKKAVIDDKHFDEIFSVDGVPLWWFYNRFITRNMIPFLPSFSRIHAALGRDVKKNYTSLFSAKMLWLSEEIKRRRASGRKDFSENPVLFLTYTNHHTAKGIYRLEGILELLRGKNIAFSTLTASPFTEKPRSFSKGMTVYDFIDGEMISGTKKKAAELHALWKVKGRKSFREAGLWPQLEAHTDFLFSTEFLYLTFLYHAAMKEAIQETKTPLICITANIGLLEKCAIVAGENLGVPVLHLQHGFDTDFRKTDTSGFKNLYFGVFGEEDKKLLAETGVDGKKVFPTGGTFFDGLEKYVSTTPRKVIVKKVLLLSQPWVIDKMWITRQRDDFLAEVEKICAELKAALVIKLHPRDNLSFYEHFVKGREVTLVNDNLYEQIRDADLVVSVVSTTISESVALNKPVLVLDLFNDATEKAYVQRGVVLYAKSSAEVLKELPVFLEFFCGKDFSVKRKKYIQDYLYALDGKSKERVVKVIESIRKFK